MLFFPHNAELHVLDMLRYAMVYRTLISSRAVCTKVLAALYHSIGYCLLVEKAVFVLFTQIAI